MQTDGSDPLKVSTEGPVTSTWCSTSAVTSTLDHRSSCGASRWWSAALAMCGSTKQRRRNDYKGRVLAGGMDGGSRGSAHRRHDRGDGRARRDVPRDAGDVEGLRRGA